MNKRRYLSDQEKADLLNAFNRLPEGRTGERDKFKTKHRLTWTLMNSWKNMPGVKKLLRAPPQPDAMAHADAPEIPKLTLGAKRQFSLKQKAWLVAAYDSLPFGSDARGIFLRKYKIYFNMLKGWREELKAEGIPLPNLKIQMTMNGAAPDFNIESYGKPGPKLGSHQKNPRRSQAFIPKPPESSGPKKEYLHTVQDAIEYLHIREEEARKIREELEKHASKTRDE